MGMGLEAFRSFQFFYPNPAASSCESGNIPAQKRGIPPADNTISVR